MRTIAALLALLASATAAQEADRLACLTPPYTAAQTSAEREVAELVSIVREGLADFPSLAETLKTGGAVICLSDGIAGASGYFAPEDHVIVLDAGLVPAMREIVLLHELRHLDQFGSGVCPRPDLSREHYAAAVMAMEADASAITALVAWSWREAGRTAPWEALAAWPSRIDIAARIDAALSAGATQSQAVAAAFDQWYAQDDRRDSYWRSACSAYLDREDETHALPRYGKLQPAFWSDLCEMPDGGAYRCESRE